MANDRYRPQADIGKLPLSARTSHSPAALKLNVALLAGQLAASPNAEPTFFKHLPQPITAF
ncbi:hypothetical protein [Pseudomonas kribbensis]|uniref:hypothetical protein n=1 Tax=Pseudomonas kribbensis TaxID=1628086 RepID=UPI0013B3875B|nr:hypothetical protein [Pseudomonas kribbensis]